MSGVADPALFKKFCAYSSSSSLNSAGFSPFPALAAAFWSSRTNAGNNDISEANLRQELLALQNLPERLHRTISNRKLLVEIDPWLSKLGHEGKTGLLALNYLDMSTTDPKRIYLRQEISAELQTLNQDNLQIGSPILSFIDQAIHEA